MTEDSQQQQDGKTQHNADLEAGSNECPEGHSHAYIKQPKNKQKGKKKKTRPVKAKGKKGKRQRKTLKQKREYAAWVRRCEENWHNRNWQDIRRHRQLLISGGYPLTRVRALLPYQAWQLIADLLQRDIDDASSESDTDESTRTAADYTSGATGSEGTDSLNLCNSGHQQPRWPSFSGYSPGYSSDAEILEPEHIQNKERELLDKHGIDNQVRWLIKDCTALEKLQLRHLIRVCEEEQEAPYRALVRAVHRLQYVHLTGQITIRH